MFKFLFRLPSPDRSFNSCLICDRLEQSKQTEPGQTSSALPTFDLCLKPGNYLFATLDLIVFEDESLRQYHICQVTVSSTVVQNHLMVIVEIGFQKNNVSRLKTECLAEIFPSTVGI